MNRNKIIISFKTREKNNYVTPGCTKEVSRHFISENGSQISAASD